MSDLRKRLEWTRARWDDVMEDAETLLAHTKDKSLHGMILGIKSVAENERYACDAALANPPPKSDSDEYTEELRAAALEVLDSASMTLESAVRMVPASVLERLRAKVKVWRSEPPKPGPSVPESEPLPDEEMCPNCVTPWKCNGPHIPPHSAERGSES